MRCFSKYNSPIGNLYLVEEEGKLIRVTFNEILLAETPLPIK